MLAGFDLALGRLLNAAAPPAEGEACPFEAAFPPARPRESGTVTCAAGCGFEIPEARFHAKVDTDGEPFPPGRDGTICGSCLRKGRPPAPCGGKPRPGPVVSSAVFTEPFVMHASAGYENFLAGKEPPPWCDCTKKCGCPPWKAAPRDTSTYANLCSPSCASAARALAAIERASLPALRDPANRPTLYSRRDQVAGTVAEKAMDGEQAELWDKSVADLEGALAALPSEASALAYLHARLGYDVGCIVRALHEAGISWGTYQDAMCVPGRGDWHCNAHSNNLVVVAEGAVPPGKPGAHRLLSMLDIDMAFDAPTYVELYGLFGIEKGRVGMPAERFSRLLEFERWQMFSVLSGADATSGVPRDLNPMVSALIMWFPHLSPLKSCLKDTLLSGYLAGLAGREGEVPQFNQQLHAAAHAYIRLAICVMGNYAA